MLALVCPLLTRLRPDLFDEPGWAACVGPPPPEWTATVCPDPWSLTSTELSVVSPDADDWLGVAPRELRALARRATAPARLVLRARMVVAVIYDRRTISDVARGFGVARDTVRLWTARYQESGVVQALEDRHRSGRDPRLTCKEQAVVLTIACQRPKDFGRCEGRMTQQMIAEEATRQGTPLHRSSVQRILAATEVRPHREAYYLFTRKDDLEYVPRRDAICDIYTRRMPADELVICMDEKSGVQVLGVPKRTPRGGRMGPGYGEPARIEQHYTRHGTRTLVGAVRPDTGELVASGVYASGTYKTAQTIELLRATRKAVPHIRLIHLVWDNGSTHRSAEMQAFLASAEGQAFHVLYTPTHASWLNLAENFLSRFSRRYLHHKRWTGLDDFDADMAQCLLAYEKVAKPMRWRYNPREQAESTGRRKGNRRGRRFLRPASPTHPARA
jgi:transposase